MSRMVYGWRISYLNMLDRLIDWLIDWLTDWLIDWLIDVQCQDQLILGIPIAMSSAEFLQGLWRRGGAQGGGLGEEGLAGPLYASEVWGEPDKDMIIDIVYMQVS